jgi:16S rRNA processing protein RimM
MATKKFKMVNKLKGMMVSWMSMWSILICPQFHSVDGSFIAFPSSITKDSVSQWIDFVGPIHERRAKKNKYENFSNTDKLEKDPMETMIDEAMEKNKRFALEMKKSKRSAAEEHALNISTSSMPRMEEETKKRVRNEIIFPDNRDVNPYDPTTYGYVELGTVLGAHGVRGEVKLVAVTDFSERLCRPGLRHLKMPHRRSPRRIMLLEGRHRLGKEYLLRLEGVDDRDAANHLRGCILYAREEERPEDLGDSEYIVSDLVGLQVFMEEGYKTESGEDQSGWFVGYINGVVLAEDMSSVPGLGQDLLELSLTSGCKSGTTADELVLIPFVSQLVPLVDIVNRAVFIKPPFGLLDLTYVRDEKIRIKGFLPPARKIAS